MTDILQNSTGISPVVGIILMVAVTVILSATVGIFVFNLGQSTSGASGAQVGVTMTENDDGTATVKLVSDTKADSVRIEYPGGNQTLSGAGDTVTVPAGVSDITVVKVEDDTRTVVQTFDRNANSTLSNPGAAMAWGTATDWDDAPTQSRVVHESVTHTDNNDAGSVKLGYAASSLPSGLVGYWTLDEDSGGTAYDIANANDGTTHGATQGQAGIVGKTGYAFDEVNGEYVTISNQTADSELDLTSSLTVSAWVLSSASSTDRNTVFWHGKWNNGSDSESIGYTLYTQGNYLKFRIADGSTSNIAAANVNMNDSQWHHVAGVLTSSELRVYKDGQLVATKSRAVTPQTGDTTFIGQRGNWNGGWYHDGKLSDIRVFDHALSESAITQEYQTGVNGSLTTTTKTFADATKPDLQNLSYTANGQTVTVTVIGSPGTTNEERQTVTLDGASSYNLTWTYGHTDFRIQTEVSTADPTVTPVVDHIELK